MALFNETVLGILKKHGKELTQDEINHYKEACREVEENGILGYKTKKIKDKGWHSLFHHFKSDTDQSYDHWLVLPGLKNWVTKLDKRYVMKLYINVETGEERVMKIHCPDPKNPMSTTHMDSLFPEQVNNEIMDNPVSVFTRYDSSTGVKGYLLQRYRGRRNLMDLILDPLTDPKILQDALLQSGEQLQSVHKKGYLYLDFKAENIVVRDTLDGSTLVDFETMVSQKKARTGIPKLKGTERYMQSEWYKENKKRRANNEPIFYDTSNDVIAYLTMADDILSTVITRENSKEEKTRLALLHSQIKTWKKQPMSELPTLEEVLMTLQKREPSSKRKFIQ